METLSLDENDPRRGAVEEYLRGLALVDLQALWRRTRAAAAIARGEGDMTRVILLVRGAKTIQRIADERGAIFSARPQRNS